MNGSMNRRGFLRTTAAGVATLAWQNNVSALTRGSKGKPNIVLIMADDLGYGDLGCYGQKLIQTPEIDKMAAAGMRFTNFHAGYSVCLPSRCTLMTGLHTGHARCRSNMGGVDGAKHPELAEEDTTVATVLRAAGYRTGMVGKWALGDRFVGCANKRCDKDGPGAVYKHGWDYYYGEPNQSTNHNYYPKILYRYDKYGMLGKKTHGAKLEQVPCKGYAHDRLSEQALDFIDAVKNDPFFLYIPYCIPHFRYNPPEIEPYARNTDWNERDKAYASMITRMDRNVGRILDRLKQRRLDENTLVIFTSDNGPDRRFVERFDSNGPLEGTKGQLNEGGLRVPTIAHWPGTVKPNSDSGHLGAFWDMMPTFAELADITPPKPIDGLSFVPTLTGKRQTKQHRYLYYTRGGKNAGVVIRGKSERRSEKVITKEADTDVVVPKFLAPTKPTFTTEIGDAGGIRADCGRFASSRSG